MCKDLPEGGRCRLLTGDTGVKYVLGTPERGNMGSRAASKLLLVGSLPADTTEDALRAGADLLAISSSHCRTGDGAATRMGGIRGERLCRPHPDIEIIQETESPTGIPRHAYETPVFRIRKGVSKLEFKSWPRIDDAIESYQVFRRLQDQGVLPRHLRFQVSLPFPSSALNGFKCGLRSRLCGCRASVRRSRRRELQRLMEAIPPSALAIQWDVCYEVQDIEGVIA